MAVCEFTASGELQSQHEKLNASLEQLLSSLERKQDRLSKLVDLYNELIEERSKKVGELEAVIKALQIHSSQIESDYKEKLDNEISAKKELEKVLYEIEEKTPLILDERVKHKRLMEAYSAANQKLQHSIPNQNKLVDLRRRERDFDVSQKQVFDLQKQVKSLEEDLAKLRMERDKMGLEANFAEELSRKLSVEVSVLKQEKETLITSEKRASYEVGSLSKRVHRLQATLEAIQSTEEVREEARGTERRIREDYIKRIEKEWAEAKKDLQQERDSARTLRLESQGSLSSAIKQVEEMGKELSDALHAVATAESKAAVAEARLSDLEKTSQALASLQKEASDLRNVANLLKAEKLKVKGKDSQLQEIQRSFLEKEERIFHLEQEVGRCRTELDDREGRVNELLKVEASLKSDVENQKKMSLHFKQDKEDFNSLKSCMLTASRIIFQAPGIPSAEERERPDPASLFLLLKGCQVLEILYAKLLTCRT